MKNRQWPSTWVDEMNDFIHKYGKPDVHFDSDSVSPFDLVKNYSLEDRHIEKLIDSKSQAVRLHVSSHPSLKPEHARELLKDRYNYSDLALNPAIRDMPDVIDHLISHGKSLGHQGLIYGKNVDERHIDKLINHASPELTYHQICSQFGDKIKPHHIDSMIDNIQSMHNVDDKSRALRGLKSSYKKFTDEQKTRLQTMK